MCQHCVHCVHVSTLCLLCTCVNNVFTVYMCQQCVHCVHVSTLCSLCTCVNNVFIVYMCQHCVHCVHVPTLCSLCTYVNTVFTVYMCQHCVHCVHVSTLCSLCTCVNTVFTVYMWSLMQGRFPYFIHEFEPCRTIRTASCRHGVFSYCPPNEPWHPSSFLNKVKLSHSLGKLVSATFSVLNLGPLRSYKARSFSNRLLRRGTDLLTVHV